jgi:uncharacterized membrane protein
VSATPATVSTRPGGADRALRIAVAIIAVVGIGIAGYLTYVHYGELSPVCGLGGDCEKVQTSDQSKVLGIPVALLGLIGYVGIFFSTFLPGDLGRFTGALLALIGFGFSLYLTYAEIFEIKAICPWCVASAVVMTILAVLTCWRVLRA